MHYITVRFINDSGTESAKQYSYMTDLELKKNDWVIVKSKGIYKCVIVYNVDPISEHYKSKATKYVAQKVNIKALEFLEERSKAVKAIKDELRFKREQAEEMLIYQTLALNDPSFGKLLDRLRAIDPSAVPSIIAPASASKIETDNPNLNGV